MRRTPKSLACLLGVAGCFAGLFLAFCNPAVSNDTEEKSAKVKELEQKRLAVLEKIYDLARKGVMEGLISHEQLRAAKSELLSARLDYADTKQERIKICDEVVRDATEWQKSVQQGIKTGVFSRMDELRAEADLLEAQIARENAEHDEE
jgi:outer membrane protein TolC